LTLERFDENNDIDRSGYDLLNLGRFPVERYNIGSFVCRKQAEYCEVSLQHCLSIFRVYRVRIEEEGCTEGFNEEEIAAGSL